MGGKKKGYLQSLTASQKVSGVSAAKKQPSKKNQIFFVPNLSDYDRNFIQYIADTAGASEEDKSSSSVKDLAQMMLNNQPLGNIRDAIQNLGKLSGENQNKKLLEFVCFMFLNHNYQIVKKNTMGMLIECRDLPNMLKQLEDQIIEFVGSDEFELKMNDANTISDLMRATEYKIQAYYQIYHKLVEQPPQTAATKESKDKDDQQIQEKETTQEVSADLKKEEVVGKALEYQVQSDFIKMLQLKFSALLKRQRVDYFVQKGFVMNHATTRALVEFLHAYLAFITKHGDAIDIKSNQDCLDFICEYLGNPRSQRDLLTQCSIIFWKLFNIHVQRNEIKHASDDPMINLCKAMVVSDPSQMFSPEFDLNQQQKQQISVGILQIAKLRGFILNMKKEMEILQLLQKQNQNYPVEFPASCNNFSDFLIYACEKNEGLLKLYSIHTLESLVARMDNIGSTAANQDSSIQWYERVISLLIRNLEYPLQSVSSSCESIIKKLMAISTKEQVSLITGITKKLSSKYEIKAKYITLNLALDHFSAIPFVEENKDAIQEMIELSCETPVLGKYVLSFFEALMRKLWESCQEAAQTDKWYTYWIGPYLKSLKSDEDALRTAVCTHITPIVVKINKMSLAVILQEFLKDLQANQSQITISQYEPLMTLLKVARSNKMIKICDDTLDLRLEDSIQHTLFKLQPENQEPFSIKQIDFKKLVLTQNWKMSLECFQIVAQDSKTPQGGDNGKVHQFEYEMCSIFIKNCLRTTFPEHRQNFMKAIRQFLMRMRIMHVKDIKAYVNGADDDEDQPAKKSEQLEQLVAFLADIISHCQENLYIDKPIESALPLFEILKMIQDLFGDYDYHVKVTQILPAVFLLSKEGLMMSEDFLYFLLNCMKSSWSLVRKHAFDLINNFPKDHQLLNDKTFVNDNLLATALQFANNPKHMVAEGAGLIFSLLFNKCLPQLNFIKPSNSLRDMQLQFCNHLLGLISDRTAIFYNTLIKEGRTTSLLHGLLSFFKVLFSEFKINPTELKPNAELFGKWQNFFSRLIEKCLEISNLCSSLLSNNRLDGVEDDALEVDCRGHPMNNLQQENQEKTGEEAYEDYDNLILVGVWLAVKENGQVLYNLLQWLDLPTSDDPNDNSTFVSEKAIHSLSDSILNMLFSFKHRGAIEKAAESFSLLCHKFLSSNQQKYQQIPKDMLNQAFERITKENHSTVLRRSAGIPPTIIAILRAEPLSNEPHLLHHSLNFLLDLAKNAESADSKIHAFNIMRFIFQDSLLRHDLGKHLTPAMILATEHFESDVWSIRNSALMCFTALTKRLLRTAIVQNQDLSNRKGLSIWEFVTRYEELSTYFKQKLRQVSGNQQTTKQSNEVKERQDMVIFSILLFISRLVPAFQLVDKQNIQDDEEAKQNEQELQAKLKKTQEESIHEFVDLIKAYSKSSTYFVRKISAQALLPILGFEEYVQEIETCFQILLEKVNDPGTSKLRQNEAHGLMIRINIFLEAYFQYRDLNIQISGRTPNEELQVQQKQTNKLLSTFKQFYLNFKEASFIFSEIIIAAFVSTLRKLLEMGGKQLVESDQSPKQWLGIFDMKDVNEAELLGLEDQVLNREVFRINLVIIEQLGSLPNTQWSFTQILEKYVKNDQFFSNHIDFVFKVMKAIYSSLKSNKNQNIEEVKLLQQILINGVLPFVLKKNDEAYCKVLEWSLKNIYRIAKLQSYLPNPDQLISMLSQIKLNFGVNPNLISLRIKILAYLVDCANQQDVKQLADELRTLAYADQKEIVRVANVKSVSRVLQRIDIQHYLNSNPESLYGMIIAIILILNDEHPEIRSYMLQQQAVQKLIDQQQFKIVSSSLCGLANGPQQQNNQNILVDLNEPVLIQQILTGVLEQTNSDDLKVKLLNKLFVDDLLISSFYREHLKHNFADKIFFFEPINKYFDLIWLKRIVCDTIGKKQLIKNIDWAEANKKLNGNKGESFGQAQAVPTDKDRIEENGNQFEVRELNRLIQQLQNGQNI